MFEVLTCIRDEHDTMLVFWALVICAIGSTSLFWLMQRATESNIKRRRQWLFSAATTSGVSVWATHFIAMLAHSGSVQTAFDPAITALSVLVAILFFYFALRVYFQHRTIMSGFAAGALVAVGVTAMHFTGMAAMQVQADVSYRWDMVLIGQIVAIAFGAGAFVTFHTSTGFKAIAYAAVLSILSVLTMHFTAMTATTLTPNPTLPFIDASQSRNILIVCVVVATLLLIGLVIAFTLVDRYLNDLQGLAEASTDGIVILRKGRIISTNKRFLGLVNLEEKQVIGARAEEFLHLPFSSLTAVSDKAEEGQLYREDGTPVPVEAHINAVEYRGRDCMVISVRDLTLIKESQKRITYLAQHDPLTGLPNRHAFNEALATAIELAKENGHRLALLALDLDRFKAVNDTFGHREGDRVLQEMATSLRHAVRATDHIARLGGDEFVILQAHAPQPTGAAALAERIITAVARDRIEDKKLRTVGTSIGIAIYPDDAKDADSLRHSADLALYRAKAEGRGTVRFYDDEIDSQESKLRTLEQELVDAMRREQFWMAYQPIVDAKSRAIIGYEALLRWDHPTLGSISPAVFIPLAEENGQILQIGKWVLHTACIEAAKWPSHYRIAVNVSAVQFFNPGFMDVVQEALARSGLAPTRLELEITETMVMRNLQEVANILGQLRGLGISIAMDDFGTGFSSLSNLQSLPLDKIKIDRSFVAAMETDASARAIMKAIVGLGQSLSLPIVAEGVETESQMGLVASEGCSMVQGYLFGRPSAKPAHCAPIKFPA